MTERPARRTLDVLNGFPLLLIPVLFYNLLAVFSAGPKMFSSEPALISTMRADAFLLPMFSGANLSLSWGDMLLLLAIIFLLTEMVRTMRKDVGSLINPLLTVAVFILCLAEFLTLPSFASSTFFLLSMIVLLHAMTGLALWFSSRRGKTDLHEV